MIGASRSTYCTRRRTLFSRLMTAGQTTATFEVDAKVDSKVEDDETFTVALGAVTGGHGAISASATPHTGTIVNDDTAEFTIKQDENGN